MTNNVNVMVFWNVNGFHVLGFLYLVLWSKELWDMFYVIAWASGLILQQIHNQVLHDISGSFFLFLFAKIHDISVIHHS